MGRQTPRAATFEIVEIVSRGFAGSLILEQTDFVFRHTATGTNRSSFLYYVLRGDTTIAPSHEIWPTILPLPSFLPSSLEEDSNSSRSKVSRSGEERRGRGGINRSFQRIESNVIVSYRIVLYLTRFPSPHCMVKSHYRGSRNLTWFLLLLRDRSPIIISTSITPLWQ